MENPFGWQNYRSDDFFLGWLRYCETFRVGEFAFCTPSTALHTQPEEALRSPSFNRNVSLMAGGLFSELVTTLTIIMVTESPMRLEIFFSVFKIFLITGDHSKDLFATPTLLPRHKLLGVFLMISEDS